LAGYISCFHPFRRLRSAAVAFIHGGKPARLDIGGKDEIAELAASVESMQNTIESRSKYNRDFVSTVMHELKMPLTAIKGAAELLAEGAADKKEARDRFISNIRHESDRMVKLVWELRELTRLDTEALTGQKEQVEYAAFIKEAVSRITDSLDREHAQINVEVPPEKISVRIMPGRIEQVLANLIDNAVRYTPPTGTITISVSSGKDKRIVTSIRDTGCGIAQSNIGKVFDRFFTTEPKDQPKDYGSGLGLAIASSIITNHGGKIWVETKEGQGASFSFTLPG
jgi:signal transduction histidine kinase